MQPTHPSAAPTRYANARRPLCGLGLIAVLGSSGLVLADQTRTVCIQLAAGPIGGTIRVLPAGQTSCNAAEGRIDLLQPDKPTDKNLSANINADGSIAQQDQFTTAQDEAVDWITATDVNSDGKVRVNFAPAAYTVDQSVNGVSIRMR